MVLRFANSLMRTGFSLARQLCLDIESWESLARREEFLGQNLAIVGNAGYLAEVNQGGLIDGYDLILRMNNFQTRAYEPQVGSRTDVFLSTFCQDVDLANPAVAAARLMVASVPNNIFRDRSRGILHRHSEHISAGMHQLQKRRVYVPGWDYFLAQKQAIGKYPTTGAMAIFLASDYLTQVCQTIYLTGFSFFRGRSHYFDQQQVIPKNHNVEIEEQLIRSQLRPHVDAGKIVLDEYLTRQLGF